MANAETIIIGSFRTRKSMQIYGIRDGGWVSRVCMKYVPFFDIYTYQCGLQRKQCRIKISAPRGGAADIERFVMNSLSVMGELN